MSESRHCRPGAICRPRARPNPLLAASLGAVLLACSAGATGANGRYPEEKRPEAPISASDGKVLGASEQDPSDTLDASLTSEHGAFRSPHAEEPAEAARERLDYEDCLKADEAAQKAVTAPGAPVPKRTLCPPPPSAPQE